MPSSLAVRFGGSSAANAFAIASGANRDVVSLPRKTLPRSPGKPSRVPLTVAPSAVSSKSRSAARPESRFVSKRASSASAPRAPTSTVGGTARAQQCLQRGIRRELADDDVARELVAAAAASLRRVTRMPSSSALTSDTCTSLRLRSEKRTARPARTCRARSASIEAGGESCSCSNTAASSARLDGDAAAHASGSRSAWCRRAATPRECPPISVTSSSTASVSAARSKATRVGRRFELRAGAPLPASTRDAGLDVGGGHGAVRRGRDDGAGREGGREARRLVGEVERGIERDGLAAADAARRQRQTGHAVAQLGRCSRANRRCRR